MFVTKPPKIFFFKSTCQEDLCKHPSIRSLLGFQSLKLTRKHFHTGNFTADATGLSKHFHTVERMTLINYLFIWQECIITQGFHWLGRHSSCWTPSSAQMSSILLSLANSLKTQESFMLALWKIELLLGGFRGLDSLLQSLLVWYSAFWTYWGKVCAHKSM
jgi:hypothetical protein